MHREFRFASVIADLVSKMHVHEGQVVVDETLSVSGAAADAQVTGELKTLALSVKAQQEDMIQVLLQLAENVAYINENGQTYYDDLSRLLRSPISISASYTQSGAVYVDDDLDVLKSDLVVTASYSDGTTSVVLSYTLSGALSVGTSTVTVSYKGQSTTFTTSVSENRHVPGTYTWLYDSSNNQLLSNQSYVTKTTGGSGGTEALTDGKLRLHTSAESSYVRFNLSDTTTTNASLSCRALIVNTLTTAPQDAGANGFRLQLSNGTAGVQMYVCSFSDDKITVITYIGSNDADRRTIQTDYAVNQYHVFEVQLKNGGQRILIDGDVVAEYTTLTGRYCTQNSILNQTGYASLSPNGVTTDIDWIAYYEES